jgi:hypothetical protein
MKRSEHCRELGIYMKKILEMTVGDEGCEDQELEIAIRDRKR